MPRSGAVQRSYSSDETEEEERPPAEPGSSAREQPDAARPGQRWQQRRSVLVLSALASVAAVAAAGSVCALAYPILKELRVETVIGHDGTEERIMGFWSILVLAALAGLVCFVSSWSLTYLDSYGPGPAQSTPWTQAPSREASDHGFYLGYGVTILNGIMGFLAVAWNLT